MAIGVRLINGLKETSISAEQFNRLEEKVTSALTRMFCKPENGGNPFLFALTAPKPHILKDPEFFGITKEMKKPDGSPMRGTAATNGKQYYWDPTFLEELDVNDLTTVMYHEAMHVILFHCERLTQASRREANWAVDYVVNSSIEKNHNDMNLPGALWGRALGNPLLFKDLIDYIDGVTDDPEALGDIFADVSMHGRSPESIYTEIMDHMEKSPRKCKTCRALSMDPKTGKPKGAGPCDPAERVACTCKHDGLCCPTCGLPIKLTGSGSMQGYGDGLADGMDSHIDSELTKTEVITEVQRAAERVAAMRGSVPSDVKDALGELVNPTLSASDIIRSACMKKVLDSGLNNDWKRFRKRFISAGKGRMRQYLPKRYTHKARWLAMLDTSGSMSQDDLVYGISQLASLHGTEGLVVSCDATVHWESMTKISNKSDLIKTKIVGRGGTIFDDFFKEFPTRAGTDFDCIIILTDGDCGTIPMNLRPPCEVVWILTRNHQNFEPTFGRVAPLRNEKM